MYAPKDGLPRAPAPLAGCFHWPPHGGVGVGGIILRVRAACDEDLPSRKFCMLPGTVWLPGVISGPCLPGHGMEGGVGDFLSRPRALWVPPCRACGVVAPCTCWVSCGFAVPKILYAPRDASAPSWPFLAQLCPPHSGVGVGRAFWCALFARLYRARGACAVCLPPGLSMVLSVLRTAALWSGSMPML